MRCRLIAPIVWVVLAVAPAPLLAADAHGDDATKKFAAAWSHIPEEKRKQLQGDILAAMPDKDRAAAKQFFTELEHKDEKPKAKILGVEKGLFVGAIETSLWTIVVFLILFFVLRAFAWGPIVEGLDKREQSIAHDRQQADLARAEAGQMRNELAGQKAKASDEIRQMMDKARADAEALAAEREAQGKATIAAERERLNREVEIERAQARKETLEQGAKLAALLSAKVIKKKLDDEDHRALLGEALSEFRAAASSRVSDLERAST